MNVSLTFVPIRLEFTAVGVGVDGGNGTSMAGLGVGVADGLGVGVADGLGVGEEPLPAGVPVEFTPPPPPPQAVRKRDAMSGAAQRVCRNMVQGSRLRCSI